MLDAIAMVPRECFVPEHERRRAWANQPLAIGSGQTISQPLVVARMCELLVLDGHERVLDVGTGSGYHAAVLARLAQHVWTIETRSELAEQALCNLAVAGVENVTVIVGDGSRGHADAAPTTRSMLRRRHAAACPRRSWISSVRTGGWSRPSVAGCSV